MNRIMLLLMVMAMGLSARAFEWSNLLYQPTPTYSPYSQYSAYPQNSSYPQYTQSTQSSILNSVLPVQTSQVDYSTTQPYGQTYNQGYSQNPYQNTYAGQYNNPYQYQRPYGYGTSVPYSVVNSAVSGLGTTGAGGQIVKNIGRSMIYSMMRGY